MSITVAVNVSLSGLTRPMAGEDLNDPKRTASLVHESRGPRYERTMTRMR